MSFSLKKITESAEVELYTLTNLINIFVFFYCSQLLLTRQLTTK